MYKKLRQWLYQTDSIELVLFAAIWGCLLWGGWQVILAAIKRFY